MGRYLLLIAVFQPGLCLAFDFGGPQPPAQQKMSFRYSGVLEPKSSFGGEANKVGALQTNLNVSVPVLRSERDGVAITARYNWLNFFPNLPEPAQHPVLPSLLQRDLYEIQAGLSYSHQFSERKIGSVSGSFGSASDQPFKNSSVDTVSATALYTFPGSETESWLLLLNYSNNRPILNNIPLPGFAYIYTPSKNFRGTFGVPFASLFWRFAESWSLTLFTVVPWVAKTQIGYSLMGPVQIFSGIDFSQMTYLLYGRKDSDERLYYDEKKVFLGIRSPLSRILFAELETGYAFGRRVFSATSYKLRPDYPIDIGASVYAKLGFSASF